MSLHSVVAGSCDYVELLLSCQIDELHSVSGYTDREVCILFLLRMLHRVDQFLCSEHVHVQVMCSLIKVSVEYVYKIVLALVVIMSQSSRADRLCIGDSVKRLLVRQFCDRVEGSQKTVLLCAVGRVCSRCQRLAAFLPSGRDPVALP